MKANWTHWERIGRSRSALDVVRAHGERFEDQSRNVWDCRQSVISVTRSHCKLLINYLLSIISQLWQFHCAFWKFRLWAKNSRLYTDRGRRGRLNYEGIIGYGRAHCALRSFMTRLCSSLRAAIARVLRHYTVSIRTQTGCACFEPARRGTEVLRSR